MSTEKVKVNEVFVNYEMKDKAKNLGCRWDVLKNRWYIAQDVFEQNMELFNDFRALAIADTNLVSNEDLKLLGCKFNITFKKWIISKSIYAKRKTEFDLYRLVILTEITRTYNYEPPPVKSDEDQLAELIRFMSPEFTEE
jgi:hypothetical protein